MMEALPSALIIPDIPPPNLCLPLRVGVNYVLKLSYPKVSVKYKGNKSAYVQGYIVDKMNVI